MEINNSIVLTSRKKSTTIWLTLDLFTTFEILFLIKI